MTIKKILSGKKEYLELLLLADEQESMIDRYLERGEMYVLLEEKTASREKPAAVCVVTDEGGGVLELKNLAVAPDLWRRGIGRKMIAFLEETYRGTYDMLQVGTGDVPSTVGFYEACGFERSHVVKDFFTDNYERPIVEDGVRLRDMVYLRKMLS